MKKLLLFLLFPSATFALPELELKPATPTLPQQAVEIRENVVNLAQLRLTAELKNDPELTRQMLNRAIDSGQFQLLPALVEIYQQTPAPDRVLLDYANGIMLSQNGELKQAISLYRGIIAENPSFQPVRFRLAQMLYEDRQNKAALDQFRKLQADGLPPQIANLTAQYIHAIQQHSDWDWQFGLTYLHENNVNNASKSRYIYVGNVPFKKNEQSMPQKANGVGYHFNVAKDWNVSCSHYVRFENSFSGKSYWDNHQYDDQQNRSSLGYQYQNAQSRMAMLPFYELRWYGNHRYNHGYGVRWEADHWLTPKWQLSAAGEYGRLVYRGENKGANGVNLLGSGTILYAFNAKSYLYAGGDWLRERTNERILASKRLSARLGWGQEWWGGLSSRVQLSYGKREFDKKHVIFNRLRKDKELDFTVTLWHRNVHFFGITPKLSYSYRKVNSNLADLYAYKRDRFYLNFEKAF